MLTTCSIESSHKTSIGGASSLLKNQDFCQLYEPQYIMIENLLECVCAALDAGLRFRISIQSTKNLLDLVLDLLEGRIILRGLSARIQEEEWGAYSFVGAEHEA